MSGKQVTLDSLRESLENKYGSYTVQVGEENYVFPHIFRMSKALRTTVQKLLETISDDNAEVGAKEDAMDQLFREMGLHGLLALIQEDFSLKIEILQEWSGATKTGEDSPSPE